MLYIKSQSENRVWEAQHDRFVLQHPLIHTSAAARYCLHTHTHTPQSHRMHSSPPSPQRLIWLLSECDPSTCLCTINVLFHPPLGSGSALHHPPARTPPSLSPSPPCQPEKTALTSPQELSTGQKKKEKSGSDTSNMHNLQVSWGCMGCATAPRCYFYVPVLYLIFTLAVLRCSFQFEICSMFCILHVNSVCFWCN